MNHHCSDPSQLLTLRVKGCFPPFPSHYSWVEWPHPTWTLSSTAASCSWHQYRCCILLLNRREHPRFVDAYGQKTMSKARRIHNTFQSYTLGILPLSSNSEIKKRSFPCPGASFLISRANDLACKAHFLDSSRNGSEGLEGLWYSWSPTTVLILSWQLMSLDATPVLSFILGCYCGPEWGSGPKKVLSCLCTATSCFNFTTWIATSVWDIAIH